jgi:GT2 family glycosyltransferase
VLVVADAAEPELEGVKAAMGDRGYPIRLLRGQVPGLSANRNTGWCAAQAPLVLFTDNDTIPLATLVSEHLSWHRRFPDEATAVVGLVRWAPQLRVTPFMRWVEFQVQFDYVSVLGEEASWAHLYGANASIKRTFLDRVGGYDEQRFPYGYEDIEWGYRAREHGLRVMLNRDAIVDHWREMTVQDWQARAPRLAVSEWRFCRLHPEIAPWFAPKFIDAASAPVCRGRAAALTPFVPRRLPWAGRLIWDRADLYWRQQIAPHFLAAWNAAAKGNAPELQPAVSAAAERASHSGGS